MILCRSRQNPVVHDILVDFLGVVTTILIEEKKKKIIR